MERWLQVVEHGWIQLMGALWRPILLDVGGAWWYHNPGCHSIVRYMGAGSQSAICTTHTSGPICLPQKRNWVKQMDSLWKSVTIDVETLYLPLIHLTS